MKSLAESQQFKVPSRSKPGTFHLVTVWNDNSFDCDCVAGKMKRVCHHVIVAYLYKKRKDKLRAGGADQPQQTSQDGKSN